MLWNKKPFVSFSNPEGTLESAGSTKKLWGEIVANIIIFGLNVFIEMIYLGALAFAISAGWYAAR